MTRANKENLTLEKYENEFSYQINKSNLNISFNRIAFIFFVFLMISIIYSIKVLYLGSLNLDKELKNFTNIKEIFRADVVDRNGNFVAKTVITVAAGINPKLVVNEKKLLITLQSIFPNKKFKNFKERINKKKYFRFEEKFNQSEIEKLRLLGDKSIKFEKIISRIYPHENLYSHIMGQIDDSNIGISGVEKSFDYELKSEKEALRLTIDTDVQFLIREELLRYQEIFRAKGSASILMDVNNGDVISMVSLPDFNLNKRNTLIDDNYINKVTKGTYELGSVFKPFTFAAGLNEEVIEVNTEFVDLPKSISCAGFPIREYDEKIPSHLSAEQILVRSGNIGSVRIAQRLGIEKLKFFLENIGVLSQIKFDITEIASQQKFSWGKCKLATAAFGHGVTTTILQLAKGYSIIANGGYEIHPTLIKKNKKKLIKKKRILKEGVSEKVVTVLRKIVSTKEGTAEQANVKGYEIAGKTGTAKQPIDGKYSKVKINTFASIFPSSNPRFVFIVMLESPKTASQYIYKYRNQPGKTQTGTPFNTAGWTSVEVAGKIIEKIGPILATKYLEIN